MLKVAAHTLGCKVNQCDTEALLSGLKGMDCVIGEFNQPADIYIINTCTVTHVSDKKSRQMIRRARKKNPAAFVTVCGCMPKNKPLTPDALGVDFIFDARRPVDFYVKVREFANASNPHGFIASFESEPGRVSDSPDNCRPARTRAFVKIQDGCDRFCSYCIVPHVRGTPASRPMAEILSEVQSLVRNGAPEIVLTGIQVATYGDDTSVARAREIAGQVCDDEAVCDDANWLSLRRESLTSLIKEVSKLDGLRRLRLSSIDSWAVNDDFLDTVTKSATLCSHFHLSLQSGCDTTLKAMNRRYTSAEYAQAAQALRDLRPDTALTTDIIVGFPGESDSDFQKSLDFVREMKFARIHVFEYSPRIGTPAADFPGQISPAIKSARGKTMRDLATELQNNFLKTQIGKTLLVLFETQPKPNHYLGHSENYCPVEVMSNTNLHRTIQKVKITENTSEVLKGEVIS